MRRKGLSLLAGWLMLPAAGLGFVYVAVHGGAAVRAQSYGLWPVSANAAAVLQAEFWHVSLALIGFFLLVIAPLRLWGGHPRQWPWLARLWAVLLVLPVWGAVGLRLNRYDFAPLWRSSVEWGPISVPRALQSAKVWAVDGGITLAAVLVIWLLFRIWRMLLPSLATFRAPRWWRAGGGLVAVLLVLGAVWPTSGLRPTPSGGDVILISLDAFRADRLAAYGGDPAIAPRLNEFARESTVFERAYCQEPWTLTSHMSMLTGLYPEVHGLDFGRSLPPSIWTLAERLRDAGWRTLGSVYDCLFLEARFGYADGFDHYDVSQAVASTRAHQFSKALLSGGPAFGFLHFYDPHSDRADLPYRSTAESSRRFADGASVVFENWAGPGGASESLAEVNDGRRGLSEDQRDALEQLYNAGVHDTDRAVGDFFDALRRAGRFDDALIIVLADHGEALGETSHGRPHFMHEELIESTLHIPLIVKLPRGSSSSLSPWKDRLTETVDVVPTVCEALGLPAPEIVQGRSWLSSSDAPDSTVPGGRLFSFARSGLDNAVTGASGERLRYRFDESSGVRFDAADSASSEFRDAATAAIAEFHRANAALAHRFGGGAVRLSEADEALLRSLGYVQ